MYRQTLSDPHLRLFLADVSWLILSARYSFFSIPKSHHVQGIQAQGTALFSLRIKLPDTIFRQNKNLLLSTLHSARAAGETPQAKPDSLSPWIKPSIFPRLLGSNPNPSPRYASQPWSAALFLPSRILPTLPLLLVSGTHKSLFHFKTFALAIPPAWNSSSHPHLRMAGPSSTVSAWMSSSRQASLDLPHCPSALLSPSWVPCPCVLVSPRSPWSSLKSFGLFIQVSPSPSPRLLHGL